MRKLTLKKETLTELADEQLSGVVGGTFRTKYDCTVSVDVCNPLSADVCLVIQNPRTRDLLCPTTV